MTDGKNREVNGAVKLRTSSGPENVEIIYIYNTLDMAHVIEQPPLFGHMHIPACPKGKKFIYTVIARYVKIPYEDYARSERRYEIEDGRWSATSLLNPSVHPASPWESQFRERTTHGDQTGNNLNAFGVFWSLTKPDDPKLEQEIEMITRGRDGRSGVLKTRRDLVAEGERLNAVPKNRELITPRMHFAMDYLGLKAEWHMLHEHMVNCPNCGELIREGLAYHRNAFNEKCVVDWRRTVEAGALKLEDVPPAKRWWNEAEAVGEEETAPPTPARRGKKTA
jgi:hypothetical protein